MQACTGLLPGAHHKQNIRDTRKVITTKDSLSESLEDQILLLPLRADVSLVDTAATASAVADEDDLILGVGRAQKVVALGGGHVLVELAQNLHRQTGALHRH